VERKVIDFIFGLKWISCGKDRNLNVSSGLRCLDESDQAPVWQEWKSRRELSKVRMMCDAKRNPGGGDLVMVVGTTERWLAVGGSRGGRQRTGIGQWPAVGQTKCG
jgi:hypothetical protein